MSSAGLWDYSKAGSTPQLYGDDASYRLGAEYLRGLAIEDWGCGLGGMRQFYEGPSYTGVDGSRSPFANVVQDLTHRRVSVEGIFMRHVLEHNENWRIILDNVLASFTKRAFIAIFTPMELLGDRKIVHVQHAPPDIGLSERDLRAKIDAAGVKWGVQRIDSQTRYNHETLVYLERC